MFFLCRIFSHFVKDSKVFSGYQRPYEFSAVIIAFCSIDLRRDLFSTISVTFSAIEAESLKLHNKPRPSAKASFA